MFAIAMLKKTSLSFAVLVRRTTTLVVPGAGGTVREFAEPQPFKTTARKESMKAARTTD
jgi:hypothetical protein